MDVMEHSNLTFQGTLCNVLFRTSNNSECTVRLCNTPEHLEKNFKSAILRIFKSRGFPEHSKLIYTSPQPHDSLPHLSMLTAMDQSYALHSLAPEFQSTQFHGSLLCDLIS